MSTQPLLRVRSIEVDKLFGLFNHRVDLKLVDRVTILHGPNGVGKTMLLRMVNDLLNGRYALFLQVPFQRFAVELDDDSRLEVTLAPPGSDPTGRPHKTIKLVSFHGTKKKDSHEISAAADVLSRAAEIEKTFPWISRVGEDAWVDRESHRLMTKEELVECLPRRDSRTTFSQSQRDR